MSVKTHDIIHITDCHDSNPEGGNLAAVEVKNAYSALLDEENTSLPVRNIEVVPAEEFNTIDVGAKFSKIVSSNRKPERLIVAVNAAPPSIAGGGEDGKARKNFVLGRLKNGVVFGGTWGGHSLSYLKSQIEDLQELVDSNDYGTQFRSLEVLPQALLEYAAGTIGKQRTQPFSLDRVAEIPSESHAWTIDNFRNVKLVLSAKDETRLSAIYGEYAADIERAAHDEEEREHIFEQLPKIQFGFGNRSVEFGSPERAPRKGVKTNKLSAAAVADAMFRGDIGKNVLALTSSARRWDREGNVVPVAQVATIRDKPRQRLGFRKPFIGAPLTLQVSA